MNDKEITRLQKMERALESIVWYNGHDEWLEKLAEKLEDAEKNYPNPLKVEEWHTEKHCIWMLGDWGTSIRGGWIEETKECAGYIRKLCAKAKGEDEL